MASFDEDFLAELEPRQWAAPDGAPRTIRPSVVFLGQGDHALEVALASCASRPKADDVRKMWTARQGRRPSPLLLVVGYPEGGSTALTVCGPAGEHPTLLHGLSLSQVERLASAALSEPTRHSAVRFLVAMLPEAESDMPGLRNSGLLATQELRNGVPTRSDWSSATTIGRHLLPLAGHRLIEALGYSVASLSTNSSVLTVGGGAKRAVAIFLDEGETFDDSAERFQGTSPVSHALAQADKESLPWVVLTRGRQIRLYAARPDTGVGRKGRAETFVEANLALLPDDKAGYLPLLFGADALTKGGTIEEILERSADFAAELAARLRERVYFHTVPQLATAVAARLGDTTNLTDDDLADAYEQTLVILFRLLFVAYAEDKDLLPYRSNSRYADHSLKRITRRLAEDRRAGKQDFDDQAIDLWEDVQQLWRAVDRGNKGWGVPGYNGGLFSDDPDVNPAGAALAAIELTDAEFGPALTAMLVDEGSDGVIGPVDFRSLSVREFGTIYEGLLESMLSIAPSDLTTDAKGNYVPAKKKSDEVLVAAGEVYFHNRSGARKATGSYFTKPFAVEHLLDHALEPALDEHLTRIAGYLDRGDEAAAADAFFDFRTVDLAMGSGHFLVAAVDRIEARLSNFLALRAIPAINAELDTLRRAALEALGDLADGVEIESTSLLRRQVARRCVYGVDLNHISVELARLAIWIHTFVPGLPLSFLDHSLVCGNSLTGIGTLDEALDVLDPDHGKGGAVSLFRQGIEEFLGRASTALQRLAHITETTTADIKEARQAHIEATAAVEPARQLFDLIVAARLSEAALPVTLDERTLSSAPGLAAGERRAAELRAVHLPIAFPEVFLRSRPGFDCILGNPPWETVKIEEQKWWGLRFPGIRVSSVSRMNQEVAALRRSRPDLASQYETERAETDSLRSLLQAGPFPGLGSGDLDLSEVFAWRFLQLAAEDGHIGVVLPRAVLTNGGTAEWRRVMLHDWSVDSITVLKNRGRWVFDDVGEQYTFALIAASRSGTLPAIDEMTLRGPITSHDEFRSPDESSIQITRQQVLNWTPTAMVPAFDDVRMTPAFIQMQRHAGLTSTRHPFEARTYNELHATADKPWMMLDETATSDHVWPVYKGASFNLWEPDTGDYYACADSELMIEHLLQKRRTQVRRRAGAFGGMPADWANDRNSLPCLHPRVAWRMVARASDTRTFIVSVLPPQVFATHHSYCIFMRRAEPVRDEAFLLGVMSSTPFDWLARRLVEINLTAELVTAIPIPVVDRDDLVARRVVALTGRLIRDHPRLSDWRAAAMGFDQQVAGLRRDEALVELDGAVCSLYGLDADQAAVVVETCHPSVAERAEAVGQAVRDMERKYR